MYRSIKLLLLKPGYLTLEYWQFRRARYMPPFRMYMVASILLYLLFDWFANSITVTLSVNFSSAPDDLDSVNILELSLLPQVGFLLLPFAAVLMKALFFNRHLPIGYHFIAVVHIKTAVTLILIVPGIFHGALVLIRLYWGEFLPGIEGLLVLIAALVAVVHVAISLQNTYGGNVFLNLIRLSTFLLVYFLMASIAAVSLALYYSH